MAEPTSVEGAVGSDEQSSPDQTGFLGPEFTGQRANPMPPSARSAMVPEASAPPPAATGQMGAPAGPAPMEEDRWSMTSPDAGKGHSRWWVAAAVVGVVVVVIAGVTLFAPKGAEGEPIAYNFERGQKLNYRMTANMQGKVSMEGQGAPVAMNLEMGGVIRMNVRSVDASGVATVDVTLEDVYVRSDPPTATSVPKVLHQQVEIAPDGRIVGGSLGFSELGATSQAPPGWDQFSPLLPDGPVSPGDTWSNEAEVPFIGDQTVKVSSDTKLLDYVVEDSAQVAVVRSNITMPLDVEVSLSELAAEMNVPSAQLGLPKGADPKFAYDGSMDMEVTARVDPASRELKGTVMDGTMAFDMTIKDMPGVGSVGPVHMDLDMSITMEQFKARQDDRAAA